MYYVINVGKYIASMDSISILHNKCSLSPCCNVLFVLSINICGINIEINHHLSVF